MKLLEITDIPENIAISALEKEGLLNYLSKKVISYTGSSRMARSLPQ